MNPAVAFPKYAKVENKPVELLKERGNIDVIKRAQRAGRFVLYSPST